MDKYTKIILTVIAILLAGNMLIMYQVKYEIRYIRIAGIEVEDVGYVGKAIYSVTEELVELNKKID